METTIIVVFVYLGIGDKMLVRVDRLREELNNYNNILNKYEDLKLKFYSELKHISTLWEDGNTPKFFDKVDTERLDCEEIIKNMKSVYEVYYYIVKSYETIGNEISFDLSKRDTVMVKFDNCINELEYIINIYDNMDLTYIEERDRYLNQRKSLDETKKELIDYKEKIDKILSDINDIEIQVNSKIRKIDVNIIRNEGEL